MRVPVLPSQQLRILIAQGVIDADPAIAEDQVQPASLDLRLGSFAVRVRASFLPGQGREVQDRIRDLEMHRFDLTAGAVLERGCVYLIPLAERLALPGHVDAVANAKSSTGRLDLLTRTVCDGGTEFDRIPRGYTGRLWAEVCPRSFAVLVRAGMRLNQLRLRSGEVRLDDDALERLHVASPIVRGAEARIADGLAFSVDLSGGGRVGWRARPHAGVIDLDRIGHYDPAAFWEDVRAEDGRIILDPGAFYILMSREAVSIPPRFAAEMAPFLAMVGEFRVHYAGFFDPGFGWTTPSRAVLEVRCHEAPFALEHGQIVGKLLFERMEEEPDRLYGSSIASHYQGQALKLSKHFLAPDP
ncbi:2'-deoxycytidine 5'-triphosphate deaminase [Rubellimicrobium sp. CFH 75288]|uniref:2'-deoxycytidine 5'-triphosphate deaminase n=1 Tax=Rubellimicrobium sp. CFH 75288 TaxID=2697034 RepID=UPI0014126EAD|nr:2'-deoxycytidine 5'-triphosphate deaminase [Rubellimicrobium sp. CFH 75288]